MSARGASYQPTNNVEEPGEEEDVTIWSRMNGSIGTFWREKSLDVQRFSGVGRWAHVVVMEIDILGLKPKVILSLDH